MDYLNIGYFKDVSFFRLRFLETVLETAARVVLQPRDEVFHFAKLGRAFGGALVEIANLVVVVGGRFHMVWAWKGAWKGIWEGVLKRKWD